MGHQVHKVHQEIKGIPESKDQLDQRVKEDSLALQVYLVKESPDKMACLDNQACRGRRVIKGHQVCQESQDCLGLVNQDSQDQRVIKVWVGYLDLREQKEIKVMEDYLVRLDPLDQLVFQVLKAQWDPQEA